MKITEVRVSLCNEERLKAFANITFDDEFVVRGLKVIEGHNGFFVSMPSRRRSDGTYQDIAHPINNATRTMLEETVLAAYEEQLKLAGERSEAADESSSEQSSEPSSDSGSEAGSDTDPDSDPESEQQP
ncbi:septation regulator SpoVG [Gemmatimonadota bacterium]